MLQMWKLRWSSNSAPSDSRAHTQATATVFPNWFPWALEFQKYAPEVPNIQPQKFLVFHLHFNGTTEMISVYGLILIQTTAHNFHIHDYVCVGDRAYTNYYYLNCPRII